MSAEHRTAGDTETMPPWVDDETLLDTEESWSVQSYGEAEWACAKVAAVDAELARLDQQYEEWLERLNDWRNAAVKPLQQRREFFAGHLADYLRRLREADPRTKSLSLPSGKVSSRITPARPVVVDEAAVIAWVHASDHAELVKVAEFIRLSELRKFVVVDGEKVVDPSTGDVLPGVAVEPEHLNVTVTTGGAS
jgi:phage host-nuclease inhibitor protein Gam